LYITSVAETALLNVIKSSKKLNNEVSYCKERVQDEGVRKQSAKKKIWGYEKEATEEPRNLLNKKHHDL
jgi:hypothetical protein